MGAKNYKPPFLGANKVRRPQCRCDPIPLSGEADSWLSNHPVTHIDLTVSLLIPNTTHHNKLPTPDSVIMCHAILALIMWTRPISAIPPSFAPVPVNTFSSLLYFYDQLWKIPKVIVLLLLKIVTNITVTLEHPENDSVATFKRCVSNITISYERSPKW